MSFKTGFTIPLKAIGKARPRFTKTGHTYTPQKTKQYEAAVRIAAMKMMGAALPFECPLRVSILAKFEPPRSWSKKKREGYSTGAFPYDKKPDADNLAKAILDAMNGVVFVDDKQVTELIVKKHYGELDRVEVTIEAV